MFKNGHRIFKKDKKYLKSSWIFVKKINVSKMVIEYLKKKKNPIIFQNPCYCGDDVSLCDYRTGEKLELRHTLEGHQLGVVSVDMNLSGTCMYFTQGACCTFWKSLIRRLNCGGKFPVYLSVFKNFHCILFFFIMFSMVCCCYITCDFSLYQHRLISVAASSSLDSHVRVWDVDTGKCIKSMEAGPGECSYDVCVSIVKIMNI